MARHLLPSYLICALCVPTALLSGALDLVDGLLSHLLDLADGPTWRDLRSHVGSPSTGPFQSSAGTPWASRNTCTMVPVVKACTTVPEVVSTSAAASRTSTPVILRISRLRESEELVKSCRW